MPEWIERVQEEVERLPAVPPYTCPIIDSIKIGLLGLSERMADQGKRWPRHPKFETAEEAAEWAEIALSDLPTELEEVRSHNADLRRLGKEWYTMAVAMAEKADELQALVDDLRGEKNNIENK
jgi:hypothetical protein